MPCQQKFEPIARSYSGGSQRTQLRPSPQLPRSPQQDIFYIGGYVLNKGRIHEILLGQKTRRGVRYAGTIPAPAISGSSKSLLQHLRMLSVYGCEFVNAPEMPDQTQPLALTEDRMHDCLWVEPSLKVLVSFEGWTNSGHLHHPQLLTMV